MQYDIIDYLRRTIELGGSDLHLSAWAPPCARVDGSLVALEDSPFDPEMVQTMIGDTLSEAQRATLQDTLELDYALQIEGVGRFRGNVHRVRGNDEAAFRYIQEEIPDIDELGHWPTVAQMCNLRAGLVLCTGVTGSGKSTTLAGMIRRISESRSGVILTLEDPIEYVFQHSKCLVKQRELGGDTRSFPTALRQALRQDPDVIVVSELRDLETIRIALTAAETGHLVLSTLHTPDAPHTVDRLVDVFPADQQPQIVAQLSAVLEAVVSQRLIPRADGRGRVLATEVMRATHGIRNCIRERKLEQMVGLMEISRRDGNHTFDESIKHLLERELITREQALHHCRDRRNLPEAEAPVKKKFW